jgi:hypothetical protein
VILLTEVPVKVRHKPSAHTLQDGVQVLLLRCHRGEEMRDGVSDAVALGSTL